MPRFSVRSTLLAVALLGVWLGVVRSRAQRQRMAVDSIRKAGGQALYTFEWDDERFTKASPPGPAWLRNRIGIDYFATVGFVALETDTDIGKNAVDDAVERLADLPDVRAVRFEGATDSMLGNLSCATQLRRLSIEEASISDAGWEPLEHFSHLQELTLILVEPVGNEAILRHVKGLAGLKMLELNGIRLTDAGMASLNGLCRLEDLTIRDGDSPNARSQITEVGWGTLRHLGRLKHLCLTGRDVTDAALKHITHLGNLRSLELEDCSVTDDGLLNLV